MTKTISSKEMRDRLLRRLEETRAESSDWRKVIGVEGNRQLLALIAAHQPDSVAQLATNAGRAQPNVSRSLSALARAGLVNLVSEGRTTRPTLTAFGAEKVHALELSMPAPSPAIQDFEEPSEAGFFTVDIKSADEDSDVTWGDLRVLLRCSDGYERQGLLEDKDLSEVSLRLLKDWWRVFHRRDAPFKATELFLQIKNLQRPAALYLTSWGRNVEVTMRERVAGPGASAPSAHLPIKAVEQALLDGLCRPVAASLHRRKRHDRPIHSLLARLESIYEQPSEAAFCRTAGALGLSPYLLDERSSSQVASLMDRLPQEEARLDFASAVLDKVEESEAWMDQEERSKGDSNQLPALIALSQACSTSNDEIGLRPWARGVECAKRMRRALDLAPDQSIGGVDGFVRRLEGSRNFAVSPIAPGALRGIQSSGRSGPSVMIADRGPVSTFFVLARAVGDYATFQNQRSCVADLYTDRQALGRAFAAELIAPAKAVVHMVEEQDLSYHEIAEHFGASHTVVERQYRNNAGNRGERLSDCQHVVRELEFTP